MQITPAPEIIDSSRHLSCAPNRLPIIIEAITNTIYNSQHITDLPSKDNPINLQSNLILTRLAEGGRGIRYLSLGFTLHCQQPPTTIEGNIKVTKDPLADTFEAIAGKITQWIQG